MQGWVIFFGNYKMTDEKQLQKLKDHMDEKEQNIIVNSWLVGIVFFTATLYSDIIGAFFNGLVH